MPEVERRVQSGEHVLLERLDQPAIFHRYCFHAKVCVHPRGEGVPVDAIGTLGVGE